MTAHRTFHHEEGNTIPSKPLRVLDLAHFTPGRKQGNVKDCQLWEEYGADKVCVEGLGCSIQSPSAWATWPTDTMVLEVLVVAKGVEVMASASCRITQRPWDPGIAVLISNVYAFWKTAPHYIRRPLQGPWGEKVPECGMPSDHAPGSMHRALGSNRATKSEEKTGLAALCWETEVEKLGLSTNRAGRHRKMHGRVALTSMSSTTLGVAPFPQLTSHSTGSIPYAQLMGRRKHQFSLVSGCSCNAAKNWWLLLCSLT